MTCPLVGPEEKELIPANRTSKCETKLVLLENRPCLGAPIQKEIVGVESLVAKEFPDASVILVGSALAHDVYVSSRIPSVTSVIQGSLNLELRNGVGSRDRETNLSAAPRS